MATKDFTVCQKSPTQKHEWENIEIPGSGRFVMPLVWGTLRRIQCKHCKGKRAFDGDKATDRIES